MMKILSSRLSAAFSSAPTQRLPFKTLAPEDVDYFKTFLKPHHIITDPHELEPFNISWFRTEHGKSQLVLTP